MNARIAIQESKRLINELFNSSKEFAERKGVTIEEAIDFKTSVSVKYAKTATQAHAFEIRAEEAKKLIEN